MVECNIQSAVIYVLEASIHFPQLKETLFGMKIRESVFLGQLFPDW